MFLEQCHVLCGGSGCFLPCPAWWPHVLTEVCNLPVKIGTQGQWDGEVTSLSPRNVPGDTKQAAPAVRSLRKEEVRPFLLGERAHESLGLQTALLWTLQDHPRLPPKGLHTRRKRCFQPHRCRHLSQITLCCGGLSCAWQDAEPPPLNVSSATPPAVTAKNTSRQCLAHPGEKPRPAETAWQSRVHA